MKRISEFFRELGLWVRYCCVWPGLPPRGNPADADCIIALAFGRDKYADTELGPVVICRQQTNDWTVMWKLHVDRFHHGIANWHLANECQSLMDRQPHLVALVQWEIAASFNWEWYEENADRIVCLWPQTNGYFGSIDVLRAARAHMFVQRSKRPIVVAHRRHMVRAFLLYRKLFRDEPIVKEQTTLDFSRRSVQPWTRTWYQWVIRETLVRIHHLVKGYVC